MRWLDRIEGPLVAVLVTASVALWLAVIVAVSCTDFHAPVRPPACFVCVMQGKQGNVCSEDERTCCCRMPPGTGWVYCTSGACRELGPGEQVLVRCVTQYEVDGRWWCDAGASFHQACKAKGETCP